MTTKRHRPGPETSPAARSGGEGAPTHSPEGVDLTLIRWMISLAPQERLEVLRTGIGSLQRLRRDDESKEEAGREKDRAVLAILRRTLEERRKS